MSIKSYDKLWRFISENHSAIVVPPHLLCTFCHKLIINSRRTPCDCKYCATCIRQYLANGSRNCCGSKRKCHRQTLNPKTDVGGDYETNLLIGNLVIKCPRPSCAYVSDIWDVCDHIIGCSAPRSSFQTSLPNHNLQWSYEMAKRFQSYNDKVNETNSNEIKTLKQTLFNLTKAKRLQLQNIMKETKSRAESIEKLVKVTSNMEADIEKIRSAHDQQNMELERLNKSHAYLEKNIDQVSPGIRDTEILVRSSDEYDKMVHGVLNPVKQNIESVTKKVKKLEEGYKQVKKRVEDMKKVDSQNGSEIKSSKEVIFYLHMKTEKAFFTVNLISMRLNGLLEESPDLEEPDEKKRVCVISWNVHKKIAFNKTLAKSKHWMISSDEFRASDGSHSVKFDLYPFGFGEGEGRYSSIFATIKITGRKKEIKDVSFEVTVYVVLDGFKVPRKLTRVPKKGVITDKEVYMGIERLIEIQDVIQEPYSWEDELLTLDIMVERK